jgi:ribosomal protein L4
VKVLRVEGANVEDILRYQHLVVTRDAVAALQGRVGA